MATSAMFGPLEFKSTMEDDSEGQQTSCLLCQDSFNLEIGLHIFLKHLFEVHHLVIEDVQNISNLHQYIGYWKQRFSEVELQSIVPSVKLDSNDHNYFLLSTLMKEDREVRHKLKLDEVLKLQELERNEKSYVRDCLFCRLNFEGTRQNFIRHLSEQHNLQLGNPQNLVFIEELIEELNTMLNELKCVYCEKTFTDRNVLKEHMRKKLHKRINPQSRRFDKYYVVNYLEQGKDWQSIQKEDDRLPVERDEVDPDEEYSDWQENADEITCLFCRQRAVDMEKLNLHMLEDHDFDFYDATRNLSFYQKVKLVNYVRLQIHKVRCIYCDLECPDLTRLRRHMTDENHFRIPDCKVYDQGLYYFPTYENDAMLYLLDDDDPGSPK